jgi:site-specific recombinase XerD
MSAILGHAQVTTTMRYTHTDLTAMRDALGRIGRQAIES